MKMKSASVIFVLLLSSSAMAQTKAFEGTTKTGVLCQVVAIINNDRLDSLLVRSEGEVGFSLKKAPYRRMQSRVEEIYSKNEFDQVTKQTGSAKDGHFELEANRKLDGVQIEVKIALDIKKGTLDLRDNRRDSENRGRGRLECIALKELSSEGTPEEVEPGSSRQNNFNESL